MNELNNNICARIEADAPVARLLRYALDPAVLSDDDYNQFGEYIANMDDPIQALLDVQWVTRFCWVRAFFENGDGRNIWQSFRDIFPEQIHGELTINRLRDQVAAHLPRSFNGRNSFLSECWLIRGEEHGESSEIWKFLTPLVRRIPADGGDGDDAAWDSLCDYADDHRLPGFLDVLIEDRDQCFLESLRAMRQGQGEGWLGLIAPLWNDRAGRPHATVDWKLYVNGNIRRLDLVADNIFVPDGRGAQVNVTQNGTTLHTRPACAGEPVFFTVSELLDAGLDPETELSVCLNGAVVEAKVAPASTVLDASDPVIFRYPMRVVADWLRLVTDGARPVCARRLAILWPRGLDADQELYWGEEELVPNAGGLQVELPRGVQRRLQLAEFTAPAGQAAQPLQWGDRTLLQVGATPAIEVLNMTSGVRCLNHPRAVVVTGAQAELQLRNLTHGHDGLQWNCGGGQLNENHAQEATLTPNQHGVPVTVSCNLARDSIAVIVLPDGTLQGTADDWEYESGAEGAPDAVALARQGLQAATLTGPDGVTLRVLKPLDSATWWWERALEAAPAGPVNEDRQFANYGELGPYRLCLWVPEGVAAAVTLNDAQLTTINGPVLHSEQVMRLVQDHPDFQNWGRDQVDTLTVGGDNAAHISRLPNRPAVTRHHGQPHAFFPNAAGHVNFNPADFSIVCCYESGLVNDRIESLPCTDFEQGQLSRIQVAHQRLYGEGMWLILVRSADPGISLMGFVHQQLHIESILCLHAPGNGTLGERLGGQLAAMQVASARGQLDLLYYLGHSLCSRGVFADAITDRELLTHEGQRQFWSVYFATHCRLQELQQTLGILLRAGYNWCAEPGWLAQAIGWVKAEEEWRRWTAGRLQQIGQGCPLLLAQRMIEEGYPVVAAPYGLNCPGLHRSLLNPLPEMMEIRVPDEPGAVFHNDFVEGIPIRQLVAGGFGRHYQYGVIPAQFDYHGVCTIQTDDLQWRPYKMRLAAAAHGRFQEFMLDEIEGDDGTPVLGNDQTERLRACFTAALDQAQLVVGGAEEGGLATMFRLCNDATMEAAEADPGQKNRAVIAQAAILCRLHAWLGWNGNNYPALWPLSNPDNYSLVCAVVRACWGRQALWDMLMRDLVPVEWMLAWFHE